jgi:NADH-quinone oxidoreductase subunit H
VNEFASQHPILAIALPKVLVLLFVLLTSVAYLIWFERKIMAHIQTRWGPYRVGPHGLLQPLADGLKFLFKEDVTPAGADKFVYFLAPFVSLSLAITSIAVIPFGPKELTVFGQATPFAITNLNIGLLVVFAITSLSVYGVALAGWSSNSKYPLLGALRSSAQMISYELALTMSVVGVILMAGTFNLSEIVMLQQGFHWGFLPRWNFIGVPMPQVVGSLMFFAAAVAETNRAPFDLAEAESELVAGFHTEYASFKFAMFFMAEYANMITVVCLATILFFGGWLSPFPQTAAFAWARYIPTAAFAVAGLALIFHGVRYRTRSGRFMLLMLGLALCAFALLFSRHAVIEFVQGPFWFLLKIAFLLFVYVWVRSTLPRLRYDHLMGFGWKFLLPLSILNVVITSLAIVLTQR